MEKPIARRPLPVVLAALAVLSWTTSPALTVPLGPAETSPRVHRLIPYRVSGDGSDRKTSRWGYCDASKRLILEARYGEAGFFEDGHAVVCIGEKWGIIDETGKEIVPIRYDGVSPFSEGLAAVELDLRIGYVDRSGAEVVPLRYSRATSFSDGRALVTTEDEGGWRFLDRDGTEGPLLKYEIVNDFSEGLARVLRNGRWGFIDRSGREVIRPQFDNAGDFVEGRARVERGERVGFIDRAGRVAVPVRYAVSSAELFSDGLVYVVTPAGETHYLDPNGKIVIRSPYWLNSPFSEGMAAVLREENGRWGYIDKSGREAIPLQFDHADAFYGGLAGVRRDGRSGFIDRTGKVVIPLKYEYVSDFSLGLATVRLNGKYGYIGSDGTEYFAP